VPYHGISSARMKMKFGWRAFADKAIRPNVATKKLIIIDGFIVGHAC
jgi:hypothetical protein